ncbi:MAG TPA: response regulator [Rhodospirillales bacterium]|nr:response regulator [Rhodospirillales bacterium]
MARILIAEDEADLAQFVQRVMEGEGHQVTTVGDGAAASHALASRSYELLVADIVMPVMDGVALALKASEAFPALRIVIMSGYRSELERAHNLGALIHGILAKPFTAEELRAAVDKALAGASPPSSGPS